MEVTEMKKILYKEKPKAERHGSDSENIYYIAQTSVGGFAFKVPKLEALNFGQFEPAQLLIRWLRTDGIKIP